MYGSGGADLLRGGGADDQLHGGDDDDHLYGDAGDDTLNGVDRMEGGAGDDIYWVDDSADVVVEAVGQGTDLVYSSVTYNISSTQVERLYLTGTAAASMVGNGLENTLIGNMAANALYGAGGADALSGGGGADRFVYKAVSDSSYSRYDRIYDLGADDRIDLSAIDARTDVAGNNAFSIVSQFTGVSGQMTLTYKAASGFTVLAADVNGDGVADMRIVLNGDHTAHTNFAL